MPDPFAGFTDQGPNAPPGAPGGGDPFAGFTDQGPGKPTAHDDRTVWEKLTGSRGERYKLWPERVVRGLASDIADAATLPGEVWQGKVDPMSPEGMARARGAAAIVAPGAEVAGTGMQIARRALSPGAANPLYKPGVDAARTAIDIGAPLPAGIVGSRGTQALTQATRQLPMVGEKVGERLGETVNAAGERVGDIATDLTRGPVGDRPTAGANTRAALEQVIENNNATIGDLYTDLRTNHIDPDRVGQLPRTKAVLRRILQERANAGQTNLQSGLEDAITLADRGASFNGLQRARSDIGAGLEAYKQNPNPGFNAGDMKRVYGAMSDDMENVVRSSTLPGISPDQSAGALLTANSNAKRLIDRNSRLAKILSVQKDESMLGGIINMASNKSGNARMLGELRGQMSREDFEQIGGLALSELGHTPGGTGFSLNRFATGWRSMSPTAKQILFTDPEQRKALDAIAKLGTNLKGSEQFMNTSNTGRATMTGMLLAEAGPAVAESIQHPHRLLGILATLGGGTILARTLARPVTAKRLAALLSKGPSTSRITMERLARGLVTELQGVPGFDPQEASQALDAASSREPLRVTVGPPR